MSKTLVCVLAETRAHSISWKSFEANVLHALDADLALAIGITDTFEYNNPFWANAKYRFTCPEYHDYAKAFDFAQEFEKKENSPINSWREILATKDQWLGGILGADRHPGSGAILIFYRWFLLHNLVKQNVLNEYDRFIITRSDFVWLCPHPPLRYLDPAYIWIPDGQYYGGITDRHAVLTRRQLSDYLSLIVPIISNVTDLAQRMSFRSDWNLEKYILFHLYERGYKRRLKFFPYVMYSAREENGSTRWAVGELNEELGHYIKYVEEFHTAKRVQMVIRASDDWEYFFQQAGHADSKIWYDAKIAAKDHDLIIFDGSQLRKASGLSPNKIVGWLTVDSKCDEGRLLIRRGPYDNCELVVYDSIKIERPTKERELRMRSNRTGAFYSLSDSGVFTSSAEPSVKSGLIPRFGPYSFRIHSDNVFDEEWLIPTFS